MAAPQAGCFFREHPREVYVEHRRDRDDHPREERREERREHREDVR